MTESVDTVHRPCSTSASTGRPSCPPCSRSSSSPSRSRAGRRPLRTRAVADAFDPARAYGSERRRATRCCSSAARSRERRPGLAPATPRWPTASPRRSAARGSPSTRSATQRADGRRRAQTLETVVGVRPGLSDRRIVVLAHRDALDSPGPRRALRHGGAARAGADLPHARRRRRGRGRAAAPARPQLDRPRPAQDARARLDLGRQRRRRGRARLGARAGPGRDRRRARARRPRVARRGTSRGSCRGRTAATSRRSRWQRTVEAARAPGGRRRSRAASRASAQWSRRALPLTVSEQGEVNRARAARPCCCRSAASAARRRTRRVSRERFTRVRAAARCARCSRSTRRAARRRRAAPRSRTRPTGSSPLRNVLPDWSVRLLVLCLLLPALLAALDAFFRARRRHLSAGAWVAWALAAGLAVAARLGVAARARHHRRAAGAARPGRCPPTCRSRPRRPRRSPRPRSASRSASLIARLLTRSAAQRRAGTRRPARRAPPSARSSARVALVVWVRQPVRRGAAAAGRPPVAVPRRPADAAARRSGAGSRSAAGLLAAARSCSWLRAATRCGSGRSRSRGCGCVATAGGHVSAWSALAVGALAGCVADARAGAARARRRIAAVAPPDERPRTRGPAGYAGPGLARRHRVGAAPLMTATEAPPRRRRRGSAPSRRVLIVAGAARCSPTCAVTLAWQEPADRRVYAWRQQRELDDRLAELERAPLPARPSGACWRGCPIPRGGWRFAARARSAAAPAAATRSAGCGRRRSGSRRSSSRARTRRRCATGPATTRTRRCPAQRGTVALAGHRTTYGAPFRHVDDARARRPDRRSRCPTGRFTYRVERTRDRARRPRPG